VIIEKIVRNAWKAEFSYTIHQVKPEIHTCIHGHGPEEVLKKVEKFIDSELKESEYTIKKKEGKK
jgi:hypothetical protein